MNVAWKRLTDASIEPVTTAEAKLHLRVTTSDEDAIVVRAIKAGRQSVEEYLGFGLITQTWKYAQDRFTDVMRLPMAAPLQSVTAVQYYDGTGALQTLATSVYTVDTLSEPGCIRLKPNQQWPETQQDRDLAVEITYVVGETAAANVRADIVSALLLQVGDRYEHREASIVGTIGSVLANGVEALLAPLRVWWYAPTEDA